VEELLRVIVNKGEEEEEEGCVGRIDAAVSDVSI